jgi:hypothetical protein
MYVMPSHTKTCSVYGRPPMCELSLFHGENTGSIPVGRAKHIMAYVESLRDGHRSAELRWTRRARSYGDSRCRPARALWPVSSEHGFTYGLRPLRRHSNACVLRAGTRSHWFVLLYAFLCALGSVYGFLPGGLAIWPGRGDLVSGRLAALDRRATCLTFA